MDGKLNNSFHNLACKISCRLTPQQSKPTARNKENIIDLDYNYLSKKRRLAIGTQNEAHLRTEKIKIKKNVSPSATTHPPPFSMIARSLARWASK
jgi:hypothetical protein